jgi:hypothetical protein
MCVELLNIIDPLSVPRLVLTNVDDMTLRGTDRSTGSGTCVSATLFITSSIRTAPKNTPELRSERNSDKPPTLQYGDSKEVRIWKETTQRYAGAGICLSSKVYRNNVHFYIAKKVKFSRYRPRWLRGCVEV